MMLVEERAAGKRYRTLLIRLRINLPAYRAIADQHLPRRRDDVLPAWHAYDAHSALLGYVAVALQKNGNNVILLL